MDQAFWIDKWQNNQIGFHQPKGHPALARHWPAVVARNKDTKADTKARVLVPLAGKSLDIIWLTQQGFDVVAVEISETAVQTFFEEQGLQPEIIITDIGPRYQSDGLSFYVADFFDLSSEHSGDIDYWYDRAALIALPPDWRERYVQHLSSLLAQSAQGLLIALDYAGPSRGKPPFQVSADEVQAHYADTHQIQLLETINLGDESGSFNPRANDPSNPNDGWAVERVFHLAPLV